MDDKRALRPLPKLWFIYFAVYGGRRAFYGGRSCPVMGGGPYRKENVGMSNDRRVRFPPTERLRFPDQRSSYQG